MLDSGISVTEVRRGAEKNNWWVVGYGVHELSYVRTLKQGQGDRRDN